jgi:beta-galactoside alpha-2,3-sialyltransferase (sialyltransferase 4B)
MRLDTAHRRALPSAVVIIVVLLAPRWASGQEENQPDPPNDTNLATSVRKPLQHRLKEAFPQPFRAGVDIFWERGEGWVSPEVYEWWASRVETVGLTSEAAERMFARIPERYPIFWSTDGRLSCAVVGASRNLLDSGYGQLIDAHDFVIRVNRAPTEDFRSDVGEKTTHHVMWPTDFGEDLADRRALLLLNPITLHTNNLFDWIVNLVEKVLPWDARRVRIINPGFVKYLHQDWLEARGGFPSTGFIAMMIAVHVCDEVDVFGFGADAEGRWDRYYEDDVNEMTDLHPAEFEARLRRELEGKGILDVFHGSRPEDGEELTEVHDGS